jgi:hypothetical protein
LLLCAKYLFVAARTVWLGLQSSCGEGDRLGFARLGNQLKVPVLKAPVTLPYYFHGHGLIPLIRRESGEIGAVVKSVFPYDLAPRSPNRGIFALEPYGTSFWMAKGASANEA